MTANVRASGRV